MKLIELIVKKNEKSSRGRLKQLKNRIKWEVGQMEIDSVGREAFFTEAADLEKEGLIDIKWYDGKSEIEYIHYHPDIIPELYSRLDIMPPWEKLGQMRNEIHQKQNGCRHAWVKAYYENLIEQLDKGNMPVNLERPQFLECLQAIDHLEEPVYKRVFSSRYLKDSKSFEEKLQTPIVKEAVRWCPEAEDSMNESEVLAQLLIEDYAQTLYIKGDLKIILDGELINLGMLRYGTLLNSQTMKYAEIPEQTIKKVITIENQANFESAGYEEGVLYIFTHGYFSPKECVFLRKLEEKLRENEAQYYHSGDLDYGGVCIFRYIRTHVFPKLKPLHMNKELLIQYRKAGFGREITAASRKKLSQIDEPLLQTLIETLLDEGWGIEQECFL